MATKEKIDWSECPLVEVRPGVQSGAPVLLGTRIPVNGIVDNFDYGVSVAEIVEQFEVPPDRIEAILTYGFEPQYGKAQGGIVQMVTKSGSNSYHGALGAYAGPGSWYAARKQFYQYGYTQTFPSATLSSPHYDLAAEFGGYIPGDRKSTRL